MIFFVKFLGIPQKNNLQTPIEQNRELENRILQKKQKGIISDE